MAAPLHAPIFTEYVKTAQTPFRKVTKFRFDLRRPEVGLRFLGCLGQRGAHGNFQPLSENSTIMSQPSFANELANLRRTFARVYAAGRESRDLPPEQQRAHRRKVIQSAMNDLEHFAMVEVERGPGR